MIGYDWIHTGFILLFKNDFFILGRGTTSSPHARIGYAERNAERDWHEVFELRQIGSQILGMRRKAKLFFLCHLLGLWRSWSLKWVILLNFDEIFYIVIV